MLDDNIGDLKKQSLEQVAKIDETISDTQRIEQDLRGFQSNVDQRISALSQSVSSNIENISGQVESEADFNEETKAQINTLFSRLDEINEKLYEFEINKKNNLIFYGIPGESRETPSVLIMKVDRTVIIDRQTFNNFLDKLHDEADALPQEGHCHHESRPDADRA